MVTSQSDLHARRAAKVDRCQVHEPDRRADHAGRAAGADRYRLYELAVQQPRAEARLIDRLYRELRGRTARRLREDFCGTAALARAWVRRRRTNRAWGLDLDPDPLDWARDRLARELDETQRIRIRLLERDLRTGTGATAALPAPDIVAALNFSYWLLGGRAELRDYFAWTRAGLRADGMLLLDAWGGSDALRLLREERRIADPEAGDFTYVWEQALHEPVTGRLQCHIHFQFDDGSRLERAFSYDWRLWTLPELRELLAEAGFGRVQVYWQGWDEEGNPDGDFRPTETGGPDAGWFAYLAALD